MSAPITITTVLGWLRDNRRVLSERFTVERIGVFGSVSRGENESHSDLDVLVSFVNPSFDHYMELKFFLEDAFGCRVDLIVESALKPRLREAILAEVRYAA